MANPAGPSALRSPDFWETLDADNLSTQLRIKLRQVIVHSFVTLVAYLEWGHRVSGAHRVRRLWVSRRKIRFADNTAQLPGRPTESASGGAIPAGRIQTHAFALVAGESVGHDGTSPTLPEKFQVLPKLAQRVRDIKHF